MSEWSLIVRHLRQPEYVHVLLNPLPLYATAMGVLALAVALWQRSRQAQIVALIVVIVGCASFWPVSYWGHRGYDRVYSMSGTDAQQWLDVHANRASRLAFVFYLTAVLAIISIALPWKVPRSTMPLTLATLAAAIVSVCAAVWISHAGGQVRHSEFREGPPPTPVESHTHSSEGNAE